MYEFDRHKKNQLATLCEKYGVKELYIFGSAVSGTLKKTSDLDFLVEFSNTGFEGAFDQFMDFRAGLEELYKRKIDLYQKRTFRNPIFHEELNQSKKLVYAA